jgi:hypothetical protein
MKRTAIAAAVALAVGGGAAGYAQANTAGLTGVWTGTYTFTMYSPAGGLVGTPTAPQEWIWNFDAGQVYITNTATFYASGWTAHDVTFTDTGSSYGPSGGTGAVNMLFDWSVNTNIPVASDWDVMATGNTSTDTATVAVNSAVITSGSQVFPGFHPEFTGSLHKATCCGPPVPVPAAVWLMGPGLLGLVGIARHRKA